MPKIFLSYDQQIEKLKNENFVENPNESLEKQLKRCETIFDRKNEIMKRCENVIQLKKKIEPFLKDIGEIAFTNSMKFDRLYLINKLFHALMIYLEKYNETPKTHNVEDYQKFKTICEEIKIDELNDYENIVKMFCYGNNGYLQYFWKCVG